MLETITPRDMQALEKKIMQQTGLPGLLMMEQAARHVSEKTLAYMQKKSGTVLFLCGPGNNGGDGFAAARMTALAGVNVLVWQLSEEMEGDAAVNLLLLRHLCPEVQCTALVDGVPPLPENICLVVDALFGTGLSRPLEDVAALLCDKINNSGLPVISVDIPSGLNGETGQADENAICATETITFHRPKPGLYLGAGLDLCGRITVAPIGLPPAMDTALGMKMLEEKDIALPPRKHDTYKGSYGRLAVIAGQMGMCGAAAVCGKAALAAGAGLVTVLCPSEVLPVVQTLCPCAMAQELNTENLETVLMTADAAAVGPGLNIEGNTPALLETLIQSGIPQVWDAGALTYLASLDNAPYFNEQTVLTPHPGEAARLLGVNVQTITADMPAACRRLAESYGCTVIVKGAASVVADGLHQGLNTFGTPAMAKGGSGDALTGVLGALLCRKDLPMTPFDKALLAMAILGRAGQRASEKTGENSLTAWQLCEAIQV